MAAGSAMILDTCALLWLPDETRRLSRATLKRINESPFLYVSAISGFEIALKTSRAKLDLPFPPSEWFHKVADQYSLSILALDVDVCIRAAQLPNIHDDPFDRFIIATALQNDWPVVTSDERFAEYGVSVIEP
jgi:PIN domain nuclease of toxin-antitoxin system